MMRYELATPQSDVFSPHTYNVLFTLHGSIMVFFFIVPGLAASFGNFLIPLMIGGEGCRLSQTEHSKLLDIPCGSRDSAFRPSEQSG